MKTRSIKQKEIESKWYIVDVSGVRLGKAAQEIAKLLTGKDKVVKADYLLSGDKVIVINSEKVDIHPRKTFQKKYYRHSGFIGGMTEMKYEEVMEKDPERIIRSAVWGMLPKTKQGKAMLSNLRVYSDDKYKEEAQQPEKVNFDHLVNNG